MSVVAVLAAGAAVAARHSIEPDHIAAISTLVEEDEKNPASVGLSWGIGHSIVILMLGTGFLITGIHIPDPIAMGFEFLAGLILVYLGLTALKEFLTPYLSIYRHSHGSRRHDHYSFLGIDVGYSHTHLHNTSLFVGFVHGFAGSGALVLLLAASAPTPLHGAIYLAAFTITTIIVVTVLSGLWGELLDNHLERHIRGAAGMVSLAVGILIATQTIL